MNWNILFNGFLPQRKFEPLTSSLGAALAPAAINTVGNLVSSLFGQGSQKEENAINRSFALEMWNKQNEYNSPKNQRKLLEEAGYNPYLFNDVTPSSTAAPVSSPSTAPLPTFQNPLNGSMQLLQQGLQIEPNIELQKMKSLQMVSDMMISLYEHGGQKQVDEFMKKFAPALDSIDWSGSFYEQRTKKEFLQMDIANDRADLERSLLQLFGKDEYKKKLDLMDKEISQVLANINKLKSESKLNAKKAEELGSEMAKNFASAALFHTQASQIQVLLPYIRAIYENNSMLSEFDYEEAEANFVYGKSLRNYKKTPFAQTENKWSFASEHNFVTDFLRGFTKSLPISPVGLGSSSVNTRHYGREGGFMNTDYLFE